MLSNFEIGQRMRSRRKELGLTLQEVADRVGVQNSTIYRYEAGKIAKIKLPVIEAIASALNVNPSWLIGTIDDPTEYDGDLIAQIPLSYLEACDGDPRKAFAAMRQVDEDAMQERYAAYYDAIAPCGVTTNTAGGKHMVVLRVSCKNKADQSNISFLCNQIYDLQIHEDADCIRALADIAGSIQALNYTGLTNLVGYVELLADSKIYKKAPPPQAGETDN